MRTRLVTAKLVAEFADELHQQTSRIPTVEEIRAAIKKKHGTGGSNNDISAFRRAWMIERGLITQDVPAATLSEPLAAAVQKIRDDLQAEADSRVANIQRQAQADIESARAAEQQARAESAEISNENERLRDQLRTISVELQDAKEQAAVQKEARENAERVAQEARGREQTAKRELEETLTRAAVELKAERERGEKAVAQKDVHITEITRGHEKQRAEFAEKEKRWENERGRSEATVIALKQQLAVANTRLAEAQEENRVLRSRDEGREKELRDTVTRITTLTERVTALTVQMEESAKARKTAEDNLRQSVARVTELEDRLLQQQGMMVQLQQSLNQATSTNSDKG